MGLNILVQNQLIVLGKVGITLDSFWAEPRDPTKAEDRIAAERYLQMHVSLKKLAIRNFSIFPA